MSLEDKELNKNAEISEINEINNSDYLPVEVKASELDEAQQQLVLPDDLDSNDVTIEESVQERPDKPHFLSGVKFSSLNLPKEILEGLDLAGFCYATPIQAQAIPVALEGSDIAGQAQTGTGKTTAFLVPALVRAFNKKNKNHDPSVLIITPTRELALQIYEDSILLASKTQLKHALLIGGVDYKEQINDLNIGADIVIGTPGRVIDFFQQSILKTESIEVFIIDEADRLLDMGFIKDLKFIFSKLPSYDKRQTMLFSATLDDRLLELSYKYMNPPQYITAEPSEDLKKNISQELYHVGRDEKLSLILGLLNREEHARVIIFVNTKSGVEWLSKKLTLNNLPAAGITGDLPQAKRLKLMDDFREHRLNILVATDVASRGIHVDNVSHVYNYDLPQEAENYVHRIGRTARAGNTGKAISFACEDYVFHLEAIENILGEKIPVFWPEDSCFLTDTAGEVTLKNKKQSSKSKAMDKKRRTQDEDKKRGTAKSFRPGGIFGLSPQFPLTANSNEVFALSWSIDSIATEGQKFVDDNAKSSTQKESRNKKRKRKHAKTNKSMDILENADLSLTDEKMHDHVQLIEGAELALNVIENTDSVQAILKSNDAVTNNINSKKIAKKTSKNQVKKAESKNDISSSKTAEILAKSNDDLILRYPTKAIKAKNDTVDIPSNDSEHYNIKSIDENIIHDSKKPLKMAENQDNAEKLAVNSNFDDSVLRYPTKSIKKDISSNNDIDHTVKENLEQTISLTTIVETQAKATEKAAAKSPAKATEKAAAKSPAKATEKAAAKRPAKATEKAAAKSPAKATEKAAAKSPAKATEKAAAKSPAKATEKAAAKSPAKATEKAAAKSPAKATEKAAAKSPAKATEKAAAKSPAKATEKAAATSPAKATEKAAAKSPAKATEKAAAKKPAKATEKAAAKSPAKATEKAAAKRPAKATEKAAATSPAKATEKAAAKSPAKATEKAAAKSPAKATEKAAAKSPAKATEKAAAKSPAKATEKAAAKKTAKATEKAAAKKTAKALKTNKTE